MSLDSQGFAWNTDVQKIPFNKAVLVRQRDEPVPFMAVRSDDYEPDSVSYLLGPSDSAYGIYVALRNIEAWADVM